MKALRVFKTLRAFFILLEVHAFYDPPRHA